MFLIFLLSIFLTAFSCPEGSVKWQQYCYSFNSAETEFAKAEAICVGFGGHLISIHDAFSNDLIWQYAPDYFNHSSDFWIGLNSLTSQNVWEWTDGTNFDFNDWARREPQNSSDFVCASASIKDGYWISQNCLTPKPFVCEVLSNDTSTTTTSTTTVPVITGTSTLPPSTTPFIFPQITTCSNGWTYYDPLKASYCVNGADHFSWQKGEDYCKSLGGHLTSIHSLEENQLVYSSVSLRCESAWIGLYTADNGTSYQWTDGTIIDFLNWEEHFPNASLGDCGEIAGNCDGDIGVFENEFCLLDYLLTICKKI